MAAKLWSNGSSSAWCKVLAKHESCVIDQAANPHQQQLERWYHGELPAAISSRTPPHMVVEEHLKLVEWKLSQGHKRPWLMGQAKLLQQQEILDATSKAFAALVGYTPADGVVVVKQAIAMMNALKSVGPATASAALAAVCPHTPFMSDLAMATALNGRKGDYTPKAYLELVVALQKKAKELSTAEQPWTACDVEKCLRVAALLDSASFSSLSEGPGVSTAAAPSSAVLASTSPTLQPVPSSLASVQNQAAAVPPPSPQQEFQAEDQHPDETAVPAKKKQRKAESDASKKDAVEPGVVGRRSGRVLGSKQ